MNLATLIGLIFGIFFIFKYYQSKSGVSDGKVDKEAESYGLIIEKVDRLVPITEGLTLNDKLEKRECFSYSVPLSTLNQPDWKLLQRFGKQYKKSDYWVLENDRDISHELMELIKEFKKNFDEEYFELEARNGRIYLFWEEWGGKKMANKVVEQLRKFSAVRA